MAATQRILLLGIRAAGPDILRELFVELHGVAALVHKHGCLVSATNEYPNDIGAEYYVSSVLAHGLSIDPDLSAENFIVRACSAYFSDEFDSENWQGWTTAQKLTYMVGQAAVVLLDSFLRLDGDVFEDGRDWIASAAIAANILTVIDGSLDSIRHDRQSRGLRAAKGRRNIGDAKRKRVQSLATHYIGKSSKEQAAFSIAEQIGAAPSSIRKILGELFPGQSWSRTKK